MQKRHFFIFVCIVLFMLQGCAGINNAIHNNSKTEANRKLEGFPSNIPETLAVEKIEVKDAKTVLVILFNLDTRLQFLNENVMSEMEAVQNNIYTILSYLVERNITKSVYYGYTPHNQEEDFPKNLYEVTRYVDDHLAKNSIVVSDEKRLQFIMFVNSVITINDYFNRIDAVQRLASADKIIRIPANEEFEHKGAILTGLSPLFASKNNLPGNRYSYFFEKVQSDKRNLIVTISSINDRIPHAIDLWNDMRKEHKISIIMVFPAAMRNHINDFLS